MDFWKLHILLPDSNFTSLIQPFVKYLFYHAKHHGREILFKCFVVWIQFEKIEVGGNML